MSARERVAMLARGAPGPGGAGDLLRTPGYASLALSQVLSQATRWAALFAVSFLVTRLTGSPVLLQVIGALMFLPLLLGGLFAGLITDRFDVRRLMLITQAAMIPLLVSIWVVTALDAVRIWMLMPFMLLLGVGELVNATAGRRLIYEVAGPRLAPRAMTVDAVSLAISMVLGTLGGGSFIEAFGLGAAFGALVVTQLLSAVMLTRVAARRGLAALRVSTATQVAASLLLLRSNRRLVALMLMTVAMNLFMFGYLPLTPVLAGEFNTSAIFAGALAASAGFGQLAAGVLLTAVGIRRSGVVFVSGAAIGLVGLMALSTASTAVVAFVALFTMGVGTACYASMQGLIAIECAAPEDRGAALGLVSIAIGVTPLGMLLVAALTTVVQPQTALAMTATVGMVGVTTVALRCRELFALAPPPE